MAENVLVIDFNIIMQSIIRIYEDRVDIKENPYLVWQRIYDKMGIDSVLKYDSNILSKIADLSVKSIINGAELINADEDELIDIMDNNFKDEKINIFNLDFFDDYEYFERNVVFDDRSIYNNRNWIYYTDRVLGIVDNITWIKFGSKNQPPIRFTNDKSPIETSMLAFLDPDNFLKENNIQYVILTKSPHYVPYKYFHLYNMIANICSLIATKGD